MRFTVVRLALLGVAVLAVGAQASAQPAGPFESWKESAALRAPTAACHDLRALTNYAYSIDTATILPARGSTPGFCQVLGLIQPEVRFEVSLPATWNGRLYMFGNGGYAGENLAAPGRQRLRDAALAAGFAVAQTDTGHDSSREPLGSFAGNPQKLIDYAYRAVHVTAVTAKEIAKAYYGTAAPAAWTMPRTSRASSRYVFGSPGPQTRPCRP